jgi:hypothetical protein
MSVTVRNSPSDIRPTKDIDGNGTSLVDVLAKIADSARNTFFTDPDDPVRQLMFTSIHRGPRTLLMRIEPGRAGVRSEIHKPDGTRVPRDVVDTEFTPVRHFIYFPAGGNFAIVLAERVGNAAAVTMWSRILTRTFEHRYEHLKLRFEPAMTEDVLRRATSEQPIKALVFRRPRSSDPSGRTMRVAGEEVELEFRMIPPRRRSWISRNLPKGKEDVPTKESLLGVLAPMLKPGHNDGDAIQALVEEGWESALSVKMRSGAQRVVNVASSRAVSMTFPIFSEAEEKAGPAHPTNEQFQSACADTLKLLEGQYGITDTVDSHCDWDEDEWFDESDETWTVVWDEPGQSESTTS